MKIRDAKVAVDTELEKLRRFAAWNEAKVENTVIVIQDAKNEGKRVHFANLMDVCDFKHF